MPCIVNAANEVVNRAFLEDRIAYPKIAQIIEQTMSKIEFSTDSSLECYLHTDKIAREYAASLI